MEQFNHSTVNIQRKISEYVDGPDGLNKIYEGSILKDAPNDLIYFSIAKWVYLKDFAPNPEKSGTYCENANIVLSEFSAVR